MTYNKAFDIPPRLFDFPSDLEYGELGEKFIKEFYQSIIHGSAEVKTDRYRNGRMVIETQHNPQRKVDNEGNQVWYESGINVTKADWWIYVYALPQAFIVVSVSRLKKYLRSNRELFNESTKRVFGATGDNPAKGFLLEPKQVMEMLYNQHYD